MKKLTNPLDPLVPSSTDGGVPFRLQLRKRTPSSPSEYLIRRTATPARVSSRRPMWSRSGVPASLPGARSQVTSSVTRYVPLPPTTGLSLFQVPPPVTARDCPGLKVPLPVQLSMVSPSELAVCSSSALVSGGGDSI